MGSGLCTDLNHSHITLSDNVTLDKLVNLSVPQFPHLEKLGITTVPTHLMEFLCRLHEAIHIQIGSAQRIPAITTTLPPPRGGVAMGSRWLG